MTFINHPGLSRMHHAGTKVQMADIAKPAPEAGTAVKVEPTKPAAAPVAAVVLPSAVVKADPAKVEAVKMETKVQPVAARSGAGKPVPANSTVAKLAPTMDLEAKPVAARLFKTTPIKTTPIKTSAITTTAIKTKTQPKVKPAARLPASIKDTKIMATTSTEITSKIQDAVKDAAAKAKTYAEQGQAGLGEVSDFAKGNVEAMVASTKILASGIQEMGKGYVAEAKTVFETMTADAKDLASAKSPTEFFEKQTAILKKNFDAAVAKSSKSSEAMLKLANEAFQPLSTRMSLAMEKVKKAA